MTELRITVTNTSAAGGTALTPVFAGFHDGSFDLYDRGVAASAGLEALAEDGNNSVIADELTAADADAQSINVVGDRGPIAAGELATARIDVDGASNGSFVYGSMLLPSNDAFIGNGRAAQLFSASGTFLGARTFVDTGADVLDAGTEVNTERDAAFINQTAPNTGVTENGVVTLHPGFNGSAGNPGGEQIILGGTNAFGDFIDPAAADFTLPGAQVATIHVNTVQDIAGTGDSDFLRGNRSDDIVDAGAGNDFVVTGNGYDDIDGGDGEDVILSGRGADIVSGGNGNDLIRSGGGADRVEGGEGNDKIFAGSGNDRVSGDAGNDLLVGGSGDDLIDGGAGNDLAVGGSGADALAGGGGNDRLSGGAGDDLLDGGAGIDRLSGGSGNDVLTGGAGTDLLRGGAGADTFAFRSGDGFDIVADFGAGDTLALDVAGVDDLDDVLAAARDIRSGVFVDFGGGDALVLRRVDVDDLTADDFSFL